MMKSNYDFLLFAVHSNHPAIGTFNAEERGILPNESTHPIEL